MNGLLPPFPSFSSVWVVRFTCDLPSSFSCMFVFLQHSYFIAPDINGLPTIPESVSIHGKRKETEGAWRDPSLLETSLPLIILIRYTCHLLKWLHHSLVSVLSPVVLVLLMLNFRDCGQLEDSNWTHFVFMLVFKSSIKSSLYSKVQPVWTLINL